MVCEVWDSVADGEGESPNFAEVRRAVPEMLSVKCIHVSYLRTYWEPLKIKRYTNRP
jgi:hypothetical protein